MKTHEEVDIEPELLLEYLRGIHEWGESWGPEEDLKAVCKAAAERIELLEQRVKG